MAWWGPVSALMALLATGEAQHAPAQDTPALPAQAAALPEMLDLAANDLRMAVPVTIVGNDDYRFVIDTGAQRTVIARELAERLGLGAGPSVRLVSLGGRSDVGTVTIPALRFGRHREPESAIAPALSYRHLGASGLLGVDLLAGHKVSIDMDEGVMSVSPSRRRSTTRATRDEIVVRATSRRGHLILTDAEYRGNRVRVVIDTGAGTSVGNMAMRGLIGTRGTPLGHIPLIAVTGETVAAEYHLVDQLRIGDLRMRGAPMAFADVAPFFALDLADEPAMLLGMDVLREFETVEIDFANRDVRFRLDRK